MENNERYEFDINNPSEIYDKQNDMYYPLERMVGSNYLYKNFMRSNYIMACKEWGSDNYAVTDHNKLIDEWYGTETVIGGYIIETEAKSLQSVYKYLNDGLGDMIDEYFSISGERKYSESAKFPLDYNWIACFPVTGGSEGHYVHVEIINNDKRDLIFLAKTFQGMEHAWDIAKKLGELLYI